MACQLGKQVADLQEVTRRVKVLEKEGKGVRIPKITRSVGLQVSHSNYFVQKVKVSFVPGQLQASPSWGPPGPLSSPPRSLPGSFYPPLLPQPPWPDQPITKTTPRSHYQPSPCSGLGWEQLSCNCTFCGKLT